MLQTKYSCLISEAKQYWNWTKYCPIPPVSSWVAIEGAGSESRTPLMHFGTVMPVYLAISRYLSFLKPKKGARLVDLGCGTGRALSYLKTVFPELHITGIDQSEAVIEYAKKNYAKFGVNFRQLNIKKTLHLRETFDLIISSHLIEHLTKKDGLGFIRQAYRLLKKGGYIFIGTPERRSCQYLYKKNVANKPEGRLIPPHLYEYTMRELKVLAQKVFVKNKVTIDQLNNPLFRKIFSASIDKFKPSNNTINKIMNIVYRFMRDQIPRSLFDTIIRLGTNFQMKRFNITYKDILENNWLEPEQMPKIPDNLLLICQK